MNFKTSTVRVAGGQGLHARGAGGSIRAADRRAIRISARTAVSTRSATPFSCRSSTASTSASCRTCTSRLAAGKTPGQIRLDIANFGNLLNHDWGVGTRLTNNLILTSPGADAQGRLTYNLQTLNGQLITNARQLSANLLSGTQLSQRRLRPDAQLPVYVPIGQVGRRPAAT